MPRFKDLSASAKHYAIAFWITIGISIALLVTGFIIPPEGEVHPSVLESAGILFLWPALAFANKVLEEGHTASISHGQTTIEIKKEEDKPIEEIEDGEHPGNDTPY